jgi:hypothetical protein
MYQITNYGPFVVRIFEELVFYRVPWAPNTVEYLIAEGDSLSTLWLAES